MEAELIIHRLTTNSMRLVMKILTFLILPKTGLLMQSSTEKPANSRSETDYKLNMSPNIEPVIAAAL